MAKKEIKVVTPKTTNKAPVVIVETAQVELYEIPQSLPVQERSRNAVRRGLYKFMKEAGFNSEATDKENRSTPANPKSRPLTKAEMKKVEAHAKSLVEAHFGTVEYPETELNLAVKQLTEKQSLKCGGTITTAKLRKNTENFFATKFAKASHFPTKG